MPATRGASSPPTTRHKVAGHFSTQLLWKMPILFVSILTEQDARGGGGGSHAGRLQQGVEQNGGQTDSRRVSHITPYLIVKGGGKAIDFYKRAFGAVEKFRMDGPDGKVGHAELDHRRFRRSCWRTRTPTRGARARVDRRPRDRLMLYVPDVDANSARRWRPGRR